MPEVEIPGLLSYIIFTLEFCFTFQSNKLAFESSRGVLGICDRKPANKIELRNSQRVLDRPSDSTSTQKVASQGSFGKYATERGKAETLCSLALFQFL